MLTQEQKDRLSPVGPGTPTGEVLRRYWHPASGKGIDPSRHRGAPC